MSSGDASSESSGDQLPEVPLNDSEDDSADEYESSSNGEEELEDWVEPEDNVWPVQGEPFNPKGWYGRLVVPVGKAWLWCKQSHQHAADLYRAQANGEMGYHVKQVLKENKAKYRSLRRDLKPYRIHGNHWERFTLHVNEL